MDAVNLNTGAASSGSNAGSGSIFGLFHGKLYLRFKNEQLEHLLFKSAALLPVITNREVGVFEILVTNLIVVHLGHTPYTLSLHLHPSKNGSAATSDSQNKKLQVKQA